MRRVFTCLAVLFSVMVLAACTTSVPETKPVPEMTFDYLGSFPVRVAAVDIEDRYDPERDAADVSSSFPTPPDILLRRYAETRLKAAGEEGTLRFIIEDTHIHHSLVQPAGNLTLWMGMNRKDLYEVDMKVRMYTVSEGGIEGPHSVLNLQRSIAIPQSYSVDERDQEKFKFLELLMKDVDKAVTDTLANKMGLAG